MNGLVYKKAENWENCLLQFPRSQSDVFKLLVVSDELLKSPKYCVYNQQIVFTNQHVDSCKPKNS